MIGEMLCIMYVLCRACYVCITAGGRSGVRNFLSCVDIAKATASSIPNAPLNCRLLFLICRR